MTLIFREHNTSRRDGRLQEKERGKNRKDMKNFLVGLFKPPTTMSAERVLLMLEPHRDAGADISLLLATVIRDELFLSPRRGHNLGLLWDTQ